MWLALTICTTPDEGNPLYLALFVGGGKGVPADDA